MLRSDEPSRELPLATRQRMRLNETWRSGLLAARAARLVKEIESAPPRKGDNEERRNRRIQIIRMFAGIGGRRMTYREIAAQLGITHQRVQYILAKEGLASRSVSLKAALTPEFLRHFARRMKECLISAGYRQCSSCGVVQRTDELSRRGSRWSALCKPCYAAQMHDYRRVGRYTDRPQGRPKTGRRGTSEND